MTVVSLRKRALMQGSRYVISPHSSSGLRITVRIVCKWVGGSVRGTGCGGTKGIGLVSIGHSFQPKYRN